MTDTRPSRPPRPGQGSRGTWVVIGLLLAPAVVLPLAVPLFAKKEPTLLGFPFYFWFQMALIPLAVVLTVTAFFLALGADRKDRAARGGTRS